jgi:hypothetical protein
MPRDARSSFLLGLGGHYHAYALHAQNPLLSVSFAMTYILSKIADIGSLTLDDVIGNLFGRH